MSVLLPNDKMWGVANWVSRGFFDDAVPFLDVAPSIADDVRFCINAQLDTLDLRNADAGSLRELLALVDRIIAAQRQGGGRNFADATAFPTYLERLEELRATVAGLVGA